MQKIILIGSGGAGKSTLARELGEKLALNVYHLDALFWKPNWIGVPKDEQRSIQRELVQEEKWIIDGNYGGTMNIRLQAADTIIFLDLPRTTCVYRVIKRALQYRNKTRPDMRPGCKEKIDIDFIKWVWRYPKDKRPGILKQLDKVAADKEIIILKSQKQIKSFVHQL